MRTPVQSFPVEVRDIYNTARASMSKPRRGSALLWGMTAAALMLGTGMGFVLMTAPEKLQARSPFVATAANMSLTAAESAGVTPAVLGRESVATAGTPERSLRDAGLEQARMAWRPVTRRNQEPARSWPIVLHRAGDGRFYADLDLDGRIVNLRVDPEAPRSTLRATDLPAGGASGAGEAVATGALLEHLRLPEFSFAVSVDPAAEPVIGRDLLERFFTVEERTDRLRLAPLAR